MNISLVVAFSGGLLSFLSPCVLPLVPVYLASLAGAEAISANTTKSRLTLFFHSISFIAGFTLIFTMLGAIAGITGYAVSVNPVLLSRIAGSLLIAFGLFMLAALKIPRLNFEKRLASSPNKRTGYLRSFLIGAVFSLGWTACVGPILGGILTLASVRATAWQGAYLLAIYSLGLGLPFLIIGIAFDSVAPLLKKLQRYSPAIQVGASLLLIIVGIIVLTGRISWFSALTS
ncbi:MAG: cytochrome c biogenesis protein CcdA [Dehalococcoidales bacterium]|nr:cytochrome c biogenesis protein CcdA [Dehalococcoidales bacterium]